VRNIVAEWWNSGLEWPMAMSLLIHFSRNPTDMQSWDKFSERSLPALPREILLRKIHLLKVDTSRKSLKKIMNNEVNLTMYPTLEKILLLKSIDMFRDISAEDVSRLIQISREIDIGANTAIFREGDEGHELFILLNGQIRIHHNDRELAVLKRGDFLGEMALLDNEPRSADAVTLSDCKLLSIGQSDFFDVLSGRPEILKGILRLLSRRLRNTISNVS
jgi:CRP/FNR family transcriptional regulator, cyclic AMP receptor protein